MLGIFLHSDKPNKYTLAYQSLAYCALGRFLFVLIGIREVFDFYSFCGHETVDVTTLPYARPLAIYSLTNRNILFATRAAV